MDEMSDESLMALVIGGEHQAFAQLVRRHTQRFFGAAYRVVANASEAEDIVQEAFLKLWDRPERWNADKGAKFTTWFYRVVTNTALDAVRRRRPQAGADVLDGVADGGAAADEALAAGEEAQAVEQAVQSLPERQKMALNLCFYEGLSNKEAANVMDVGVKALESLLMRAKAAVRDDLTRKGLLEVKNVG